MITTAALDISTGPAHFSDRRASTFYLSLARTDHLDICRATRFQIVVARTMTNHSMYFSRGRKSHLPVVFPLSFATARRQRDASQACQPNTLTSVFRSRRTRYFNANIRERTPSGSVRHPGCIRALFSTKHMSWFRVNSFAFWSVNLKYLLINLRDRCKGL